MIELKAGQKYTIIYVSESSAATYRSELTIVSVEGNKIIYKMRNKRQLMTRTLNNTRDMVIMQGWDIPLKIDTDCSSYMGNAMLNFVGEPNELRSKIETLNINPDLDRGLITFSDETDTSLKHMLYPKAVTE